MRTLGASLATAGLTLTVLATGLPASSQTVDTDPGRPTETVRPYGGCGEAWQSPRSTGAEWCRSRGWIVRARIVIGPKRFVHMTALPHCRYEDGSGQRSSCTWNVGTPVDGNGIGRAYVVWANGTDTTVKGMVR
jgi:hypothetical protein